jgi:hypothetical protein
MHPAVIDCHACSPVAALVWYEWAIPALAGLLEAQAGVATHSYAAVLDALAELVQQRQAEPRSQWPTSPKVFGPAMRHARMEQHFSRCPASCGANIFATPMGECAQCAGAQLRAAGAAQGQQHTGVAAPVQPPASAIQPASAGASTASAMLQASTAAPSDLLVSGQQQTAPVVPASLPTTSRQQAAAAALPADFTIGTQQQATAPMPGPAPTLALHAATSVPGCPPVPGQQAAAASSSGQPDTLQQQAPSAPAGLPTGRQQHTAALLDLPGDEEPDAAEAMLLLAAEDDTEVPATPVARQGGALTYLLLPKVSAILHVMGASWLQGMHP